MASELVQYGQLLTDVKTRIQKAQIQAVFSANREMIMLYWDIGRLLVERQQMEGWGARVLRKLSEDLKNELPSIKGFSERNLKRMTQFCREYPDMNEMGPPPVAQLATRNAPDEKGPPAVAPTEHSPSPPPALVLQLPWSHNMLLIQKIKEPATRTWYMQQTISQGWSRNILEMMIQSNAHQRQGEAVTNFEIQLPAPQSDLAQQAMKDPYLFDFLTIDQPFRERELETGLVHHIEKFLLELGAGFAFVGRQYHLAVGDDDFYLDLLFYHLKLRCFVVIDLKVGPFKADYAGKMNFYLNVVDDHLKHEHDNPTIGLILCQDKKQILAEYALRGIQKPIGISQYALTRALPTELKSSLPTIEQIEAELSGEVDNEE